MARQLITAQQISQYVAKIIDEAQHHAVGVVNSIRPLEQVVTTALNSDPSNGLLVYERNGQLARTCWLTTPKGRFCFSYNYSSGDIELRDKSTQGSVLFTINDTNVHAQTSAISRTIS